MKGAIIVTPRPGKREHINPFLGIAGAVLLLVAIAGFFIGRPAPIVGGFLIGGIALCFMAVVTPRLEGSQEIGLTGAKFNLAAVAETIKKGEIEIETKSLPDIQEILP